MLSAESLTALREKIASHEPPILSLYLDVNPSNPDNARRAYALRAREAIHELGLPKSYVKAVVERLNLEEVIPQGRTLMLFAGEDLERLFEANYLQTDIRLDGADGVLARWGSPYLTPLLQVTSEHERYGIVYVDQERWRYFEIFLKEAVEVAAAVRPIDAGLWRRLEESSTGVPGVPARGGSGKDKFDRRMLEWSHRFYKRVACLLERAVRNKEVRRIITVGPPECVQAFESVLPGSLREKIVARLPPLANPNATANEVSTAVLPSIERVERELEHKLLDEMREKGLWGPEPVVSALVDGRLYRLALPCRSDRTVYRCSDGGRIAATLGQATVLCPEGRYELLLLKDVVFDLAKAHAVELKFLRGDAERRLLDEFGGLAGLPRWWPAG